MFNHRVYVVTNDKVNDNKVKKPNSLLILDLCFDMAISKCREDKLNCLVTYVHR